MSNRCGTCKNFIALTSKFDKEYHGEHAGNCISNKFEEESGLVPIDGLIYWDSEGYAAGLYVGNQFGCIHWEIK